ncbi:MAG: hypothetical protein PHU34_11360 [Candidatus Methanoperedens sp.]|nr:hypothetical protein [Candidatus Methanoperedens sp.]
MTLCPKCRRLLTAKKDREVCKICGASFPLTKVKRTSQSLCKLHGEAFFKAFDETFGLKPIQL